MAISSLKAPLMSAILDVIYSQGQTATYDTDWITERIRKAGFWDHSTANTPHRTVNKNFSQSPDLFEHIGPNLYRLRPAYFRVDSPTAFSEDSNGDQSVPGRIQQTVYRTLRQTKLVQQLKLLHAHRCQICELALEINGVGYSEGHHIRPLGHKGLDIVSNILILCPNHHVLCDYGGIKLSLANIRLDSRHLVAQEYIDWHNKHYFGD